MFLRLRAASEMRPVSPAARFYSTALPLPVLVFYFNSHPSYLGFFRSVSRRRRLLKKPTLLFTPFFFGSPPPVSLLPECATFTLCARSLITFFPPSYSSESFPLETARGRLVLYRPVRLFSGGGERAAREDFRSFLNNRGMTTRNTTIV